MAQIKIYGHREFIRHARKEISNEIHGCTVAILGLPEEKRFHRFFPMEPDCFVHPTDRSDRYVIVEASLMAGRSTATKKEYIRGLISALNEKCGIPLNDIEVTLHESPKENWGIRGSTGDELVLNYTVEK